MEADGSIQVNHWQKKSLQFRLVIKLSNIITNYNMLLKIANTIGGYVRITGKGKEVIWVVNNRETIIEIIKIFDLYPLLTSRKICQLEFLKKCLLDNSSAVWRSQKQQVENYLLNRNFKYINQSSIINKNPLSSFINGSFVCLVAAEQQHKQQQHKQQNCCINATKASLPYYFNG